MLVLGAVGLVRGSTGEWLAIGICIAALAVQGLRYASLERLGRLGTLASVGLNLALGLAIVALKVIVAH
jgi:drug/metabolite transporter (DMT)-like permease